MSEMPLFLFCQTVDTKFYLELQATENLAKAVVFMIAW